MKKSNLFLAVVCILQFTICNLQPVTSFAQYTKLLDFAGAANGSFPYGSLVSDGTFLYGMASVGGANNKGVVFKIKPDGTGYADLLDFAGATNGGYPDGSLISDGTFLYGMTSTGGTSDLGTLFKIKPDGTGYAKLLDFTGAANGSYPYGSLISDGTFLYGMAQYGGANNKGLIFKIKPDGTGYAKLLDFSGTANGANPSYGSLISDGTFLYGMTKYGGTDDMGVIFKIKPDGTGYAKLLDFTGAANGDYPYGSLFSDGAFLFGMTYGGGANSMGVIFKIKPDGTGYSKLLDFAGSVNGANPHASFISDGTFLYGMTDWGGANNKGVIFKIKPDGTGYSILFDFAGATNGSHPYGSLISDGTFLYGMTQIGGTNDMGVIFKYQYSTAAACTASITGDTTICAGQNTTLTASGGTSYSWSNGATNASIIVSPPANTTYTVTAATGTCVATSIAMVTVNPNPTASAAGNPTSIASGSLTTIIASGGGTYQWSPSAGLNNTTGAVVVATPTGTITYCVMVMIGGCTDTACVTVNVTATGVPSYANDPSISVFPNPASGKFQVISYGFQVTDLEIYNVMGEKVYEQAISGLPFVPVNLSSQPDGIYFIQLKSDTKSFTSKLIIHK